MKKRKLIWKSICLYLFLFEVLLGQSISYEKVISGVSKTLNEKNTQLILLTGLLGSGIASHYDNSFQSSVESKGVMPKGLAQIGDYWGIGGQLLLWGAVLNSKEKNKNQNLEYAMNAFIANGVMTYGMKFAIGRERPDRSNKRSFPSGHTSNSFLTATIAQEVYGNKIGIPAYMLACVTGLSRIHDDKHYVSDVVFGAALGTAIGKGFGKIYQTNLKPEVSILPQTGQLQINLIWDL